MLSSVEDEKSFITSGPGFINRVPEALEIMENLENH